MVITPLCVGAYEENCFLVEGNDRHAVIIDPGSDADQIIAILKQRALTLSAYLLTHGHIDHLGALDDLLPQYPAPVAIHPADGRWAFTRANQLLPEYPAIRTLPPERVDLHDGKTVTYASLSFTVIATPGHTPGSVCFAVKNENILFTGDTLFAGSVGRTDLPGGDGRSLQKSLAGLLRLPPSTRIYPGHGPHSTLERERRSNPYLQPGAWD